MTMTFGTQSEVRKHLVEVALRDVRRWLKEHRSTDPHPDHLYNYQDTYSATRLMRALYLKGISMTTALDDELWKLEEITLPGTTTVVLARLVTPWGSLAIWSPDNLLELLKESPVTVGLAHHDYPWWRWFLLTVSMTLRGRFVKRFRTSKP